MAADVYTFEKTLSERLTEYQTILCMGKESLPAHKIRSVWSSYLELLIEPSGWNAIWKICRRTCKKYGIGFPTVVFVVVLRVDCSDLSAVIEVAAVQDDIHLPQYHRVPMIHLYPTKQQRKKCLRIEETAECLDQLRFFFNHLWRPWDDINGHCKSDWPTIYLQLRIDLLEVMQSDVACREKWEYLRCLLQEAKDVKQNIDAFESELTDDREVPGEITYLLTKYHLRMNQIKKEVQIFESPLTRKLLIQRQKTTSFSERTGDKRTWIILHNQSVQDIGKLMTELLKHFSSATFVNACSTVQRALESSFEDKLILLSPGCHQINDLDIQRSFILRGIAGQPLTSTAVAGGSCILDCPGGTYVLENLVINCETNAAAVIVRSGYLKVRNCHFQGTKISINSPAIIVLQGAHVEIQNSTFSNLGMALIVCSGAVVHIASSEICSCSVGLQLSDDAILVTDGLKIIKSTECAMKIECVKQETYEKITGTADIVSGFCGIKSNNLAIESTVGNEVVVIHNEDLLSYEDACS